LQLSGFICKVDFFFLHKLSHYTELRYNFNLCTVNNAIFLLLPFSVPWLPLLLKTEFLLFIYSRCWAICTLFHIILWISHTVYVQGTWSNVLGLGCHITQYIVVRVVSILLSEPVHQKLSLTATCTLYQSAKPGSALQVNFNHLRTVRYNVRVTRVSVGVWQWSSTETRVRRTLSLLLRFRMLDFFLIMDRRSIIGVLIIRSKQSLTYHATLADFGTSGTQIKRIQCISWC